MGEDKPNQKKGGTPPTGAPPDRKRPHPEPDARRGGALTSPSMLILIAIVALLPHLGAFQNGFVFDDGRAIVDNPAVTTFDLHALWTQPYWVGWARNNPYRPLTSTTYAISWALGGGKPASFIVLNLLLHVGVTLAGWSLLRRLFPSRPGIAAAVSLLFAVHPLHVEAVVGIVGRADLLSALLGLLAYRIWLDAEKDGSRPRALLSAALWFLALLSKESAAGLLLLPVAHRVGLLAPASPARRLRVTDVAWPAALLAMLALRAHALGMLTVPIASWVDNPLASLDPLRRALGACGVLARQLPQVLAGLGLSADYSYAQVAPGIGLYIAGAVTLICLGLAVAWAVTRGRSRPEAWGVVFFAASWIVTSNLILPIGTIQADRLLYLPLMGLSVAVVAAVGRIHLRGTMRQVPAMVLILAIIGFGISSAMQTECWRSERTLFESAVRRAPRSLKARANLAAVVLQAKTQPAAREALALLKPMENEARTFGPYIFMKAKATMFLGDRAQARELFRSALAEHADSAETLVELGNLALLNRDGEEALRDFDGVGRNAKFAMNAAIGRASALAVLRRYGEAADTWLPVVAALPDSVPLRAACGLMLAQAGRADEGARLLREGLKRKEDPRLLNNLARAILAGAASPQEAVDAATRAVAASPSPVFLTTLAVAQVRAGQRDAAQATRARVRDPRFLSEIDAALGPEGAKP